MDCTGKLVSVTHEWLTNKVRLLFEIEEKPTEEINDLLKMDKLSITAKKWRKKRSLDANGYYWKLVEQIAESINVSKPFLHNRNLRRYGQIAMLDGKPMYLVLPDTEESQNEIEESETYHLKPTTQVKQGKDGLPYRTYMMLVGSSEFDTKQMSVLIDGVVSEAKELGIETMTPAEIERMVAAWKA